MGSVGRPRLVVVAVAGIVLVLSAVATTAVRASNSPGQISTRASSGVVRPLALVYRGPAGCAGCSEAVAALIRKSPLDFRVQYVGPSEARKLTGANLRGVALYAQPGGDDSVARAMKVMGTAQTDAVRAYVLDGGHYVGFCMGAYLAGEDPGMGMLSPGDTGEYSMTKGALAKGSHEAVIPVRWGKATRYMYVQDAPYIIPSHVAGEQILSTFTNGMVNALVKPYGAGRVGVVGSHPEADRSWYTTALWAQDLDGLDTAQGLQLIAVTMEGGPRP